MVDPSYCGAIERPTAHNKATPRPQLPCDLLAWPSDRTNDPPAVFKKPVRVRPKYWLNAIPTAPVKVDRWRNAPLTRPLPLTNRSAGWPNEPAPPGSTARVARPTKRIFLRFALVVIDALERNTRFIRQAAESLVDSSLATPRTVGIPCLTAVCFASTSLIIAPITWKSLQQGSGPVEIHIGDPSPAQPDRYRPDDQHAGTKGSELRSELTIEHMHRPPKRANNLERHCCQQHQREYERAAGLRQSNLVEHVVDFDLQTQAPNQPHDGTSKSCGSERPGHLTRAEMDQQERHRDAQARQGGRPQARQRQRPVTHFGAREEQACDRTGHEHEMQQVQSKQDIQPRVLRPRLPDFVIVLAASLPPWKRRWRQALAGW